MVVALAEFFTRTRERNLNEIFRTNRNDSSQTSLSGHPLKVLQMVDGVSLSPKEDLERMVAASLAGALEGMLRRSEAADRSVLLQTLRSQMTKALSEAPLKGDVTRATALRARMAAMFEAEFTRMEAAQD